MLRVGTDLLSVADVEAAVAAHGERYLRRVFTARELDDCAGAPERLAARFAAKEAAIKVLRPADRAVPWREIEVRRDPAGWVGLHLFGSAAALAEEQGLGGWAVSLAHERELATAVVIAEATT
jgi:holo-[acyl-carrier protein] synthase